MQRLTSVLKNDGVELDLLMLIRTILAASKEIAFRVSQGDLAGVLGSTLDENIQGEVQKKLDVLSNQLIKDMLLSEETVKAIASEEEDDVVAGNEQGKYVVAFDPLDGSSNIDINGQIGTIFTIYQALENVEATSEAHFLQKGTEQVCAGYILYGASTLLVMSTGGPTRLFTLDLTHGGYLLTTEQMSVPESSNEFAVNLANYRYWDELTQVYFDDVLYGSDTFKQSSMRWNAAMVGDVHRILCRGGVFLYPADRRDNLQDGKIRLLYEANPLSFLMEHAGGKATSRGQDILHITPTALHQRVPVALGSNTQVCHFEQRTNDPK
jgi:fructose-1,6-bisphosphatase I